MRIVKARLKTQDEFPPIELCCAEAIAIQQPYYGSAIMVDLDDVTPYDTVLGHCGQELPYEVSVRVIEGEIAAIGYVPVDLIEIDEGVSL